VRANAFDHVALWVDDRDGLAEFLCSVLGAHEIERTDAFTLVGGDAKQGKLTLFEADGPRDRGVLERIVLRVPDLGECVERAWAGGFAPTLNGGVSIEAPANVPIGLVQAHDRETVDLDHVVLRVPDPASTAARLDELGFDERDGRLELGDRHIVLRDGASQRAERPLLNHLALLVDSVSETVREAERHDVVVDRLVDAPNTLAAFVVGPDEIVLEYVEHKPGFALV
jgi:catechol 2,3-dioxygenase-like lactoylglutathione lyase family enzyme